MAAAYEFMGDYPHLKKNTVVIDSQRGLWSGRPSLLKAINNDPLVFDDVEYGIKWTRRHKSSYVLHSEVTYDSGRSMDVDVALFHPAQKLFYDPESRFFDDAATFDHEMTHLLERDVHDTPGENIADARAVIRHFQRFGTQQENIGYCGWRRALEFMQEGETSHLTTFTLDQIYNDKNTAGFDRMSPDETLQAARHYAVHTPAPEELQRLSADFNAVAKKPVDDDFFHRVAQTTLAAETDSKTFYLGARVLMPALGAEGIRLNGRRIRLHGQEWEDMRQEIEKKLGSLPAGHILPKTARMRL